MTSRLTTVSFHCLRVDSLRLLTWMISGPGDLLDRRLYVAGRAVTRIDDQQVLNAADDKQLIIKEESRVSGAQLRPSNASRRSDEPSTERAQNNPGRHQRADR